MFIDGYLTAIFLCTNLLLNLNDLAKINRA